MKKKNKRAQSMCHDFYMNVFAYINMEYKPKYSRIYADSEMSESLVELVSQYFWGGNTVPFVAGQIVDLIKSKYKNTKG